MKNLTDFRKTVETGVNSRQLWNLYLFGHPRATWAFSKLQENFRCNLPLNERENFSDSSLHDIFESQSFRFPFSAKNSLSWGVKYEKLNVRKS